MGKIGRNKKCPCGSGKKYKKCCLNKKNNSKEERFILTKNFYEEQLLPYYESDTALPKSFLEFSVVLPFHIPVYEGTISTISDENNYLSYKFEIVEINESKKHLIHEPIDLLTKELSLVQILIASNESYKNLNENKEVILNKLYDKSIEKLNEIILAFITSEKDPSCHYLTKEMLSSHVVYRLTDLDTWEEQTGLFILHSNVPFKKERLSPSRFEELVRIHRVVMFELNPFINVEQHVASAKRYFLTGFYQEAVIYIQMSIDVFIRELYKVLLKEGNKKSDEEISDIITNTSFMKIVKNELSKFIGGKWDLSKESTEIFNWYNNTYQLRNRVVHAGTIPNFHETDNAITSANAFRLYIVSLILEKKNKYPILNGYFHKEEK